MYTVSNKSRLNNRDKYVAIAHIAPIQAQSPVAGYGGYVRDFT